MDGLLGTKDQNQPVLSQVDTEGLNKLQKKKLKKKMKKQQFAVQEEERQL
jgi:hypothetical protein